MATECGPPRIDEVHFSTGRYYVLRIGYVEGGEQRQQPVQVAPQRTQEISAPRLAPQQIADGDGKIPGDALIVPLAVRRKALGWFDALLQGSQPLLAVYRKPQIKCGQRLSLINRSWKANDEP